MTRRIGPAALLAAASLAWSVAAGCSKEPVAGSPPAVTPPAGEAAPPPPLESALAPVTLPNVSSTAGSVRAQLQTQYEALASMLTSDGLPPGEQARAYGAFGNYLMAATFFDDAALCYSHAEALEPANARWPYLRGHAVLRKGDREQAARAFERAVAIEPSLPALVWLGDTYLDLDRVDEAQGTFARAVAREPESAAALFGAGRVALARGAYADAVSNMEHALRVDPRASAIHYPLAMAYRGAGQPGRAAELLQKRGTVAPGLTDSLLEQTEVLLDSAVSHEALGMAALRRQDWTGAIQAFRRGLAFAPRDPSLRYWMATAMIASGDAVGAEHEFRTVVREQPDFAKAHFSLGAVLDRRGERGEALREYEAAVRAAPNMPEARLRLADTLRLAGQFRPAMAQYEAVISLAPNLAEGWIGGTQVLLVLGEKEQARDWIGRGRRLHPGRTEWAGLELGSQK